MRRFALIALLFSFTPAFADDPQAYAVFRGGSHTQVDYCISDGFTPANGDIWIPFVPVNGDMVIQDYDYTGTDPDYVLIHK